MEFPCKPNLCWEQAEAPLAKTNQYTQAEDGKTEMSLVHFALTNPGWKPSHDNEKYLTGLRLVRGLYREG
jgi:hypothetical protein